MSLITSRSSNPNKTHKNYSSHYRNNSGEIDVFQADRYFSTANENTFQRSKHHPTARMSLDIPMRINPIYPQNQRTIIVDQKQINKEHKKFKQPSSPGGRLASFLNSLFNQNKKKSKNSDYSSSKDVEQDDVSPNARRKRRTSISHFRITNGSNNHSKKSGFRTPPPYANTPTKSCRDFRSFLEQRMDKNGDHEKIRVSNILEDNKKRFELSDERKLFRKFIDEDDDDDDESDSSSDLFDLPNHELDFYSSGLPVYETTHMDRIRIGTTV